MLRPTILCFLLIASFFTTTTFSQTMTEKNETYSYSPSKLMESYRALEAKMASSAKDSSIVNCANPLSRDLVVAAVQLTAIGTPDNDIEGFWTRVVSAIREAAHQGATVILVPELFMGPYFCQSQEAALMGLAVDTNESFIVRKMQTLAKELGVVLPISLYERKENMLFNTIVMIDADGTVLGIYRKSHIPDGTGYQEKFYFSPGDTGFRVWQTKVGKVGVAICWDQWFPEAARAMALQGADVLLYPTAIGSEPQDPTINSRSHWQRVMQGHSAANMVPVVASNRFGTEILMHEDGTEKQRIHFYGRSFITDETGAIVKEAQDGQDILVYAINAQENRATRLAWGLFRDRRPELYGVLLTKDGSSPSVQR